MNVLHKIFIVISYVKISVTLHMVMKLCPPTRFPLGWGNIVFGADPVGVGVDVRFSFPCIIF